MKCLISVCFVAAISSELPLTAVRTTSPQPKLQRVIDEDLIAGLKKASSGASNVFLVEAANIEDAMRATSSVLRGSHRADTPATANRPDPSRGRHWMVAYLGMGPSNPTWWTIDRVEMKDERIRLTFRQSKATLITADIHHYYYWIPLKKLQPGTYQLELYDAKNEMVSLMRNVEVRNKE